MATTMQEVEAKRRELKFRGEPDLATLRELVRAMDRSPATTWTGQGGVKDRILALIERTEDAIASRADDGEIAETLRERGSMKSEPLSAVAERIGVDLDGIK